MYHNCGLCFAKCKNGKNSENQCSMVANNVDSLNIGNGFSSVQTGYEPIETKEAQLVHEAEVDGIDILVNMANQGKLNPWAIDIVDVTDKYLAHLFQSKSQNLRMTGRTLLFAAILLKLKSNILEGINITDFTPQEDNETDLLEDGELEYSSEDVESYSQTNNVVSIDEVLQRRTSVRLNHNRVVTLRDLIRQLEFYEQWDRKQSLKNAHERAIRRLKTYSRMTPDDIVNMAHDEYIKDGVQRLKANLEEILNRQDKIELNELTLLGMDRISAYISLLFLTTEGDYDLVQQEFYSDLYVIKKESSSENSSDTEDNTNLNMDLDNTKNILLEQEENDGTVEIQN